MEIRFKTNTGDVLTKLELHGSAYHFVALDGLSTLLKIEIKDGQAEVFEKAPDLDESPASLHAKLEEWMVEYNPKGEVGSEVTESENIEEEWYGPYDLESIRVDPKIFSLRQIFDMINNGDIDLNPDFQRHLVWDNLRKSRLIESILLRIPLPMFYFAADEDGKIVVVDGLQRLNAIFEFMSNRLKLDKLEYLQEKCGGKVYGPQDPENKNLAIDPKYFRWFNMTQITANLIDPSSPFSLKYDIFRRINTGGQPLNSQEIRNCLASKGLREVLKKMAQLPSFAEATANSVKDVRMEAQEFALRFLLFSRKYKENRSLANYSGNMENELNMLMDTIIREKEKGLSQEIDRYDNALKNANYLFGAHTFRKSKLDHLIPGARRQLINKALFISWAVLLADIPNQQLEQKNQQNALQRPLAKRITDDSDFFLKLTYSTNAKANLQKAFEVAEDIIRQYIK